MQVTAEQLVVLGRLEHGAYFNVTHTTARELIAAGLACEEWGRLALTEEGRIALRRPAQHKYYILDDNEVADMSAAQLAVDPMTSPHLANQPIVEEAPAAPLSPACDTPTKAMRAAGVASGKTGVWVDKVWVDAFIEAFDDATE